DRSGGDPHADLRLRAGARHGAAPRRPVALGGEEARARLAQRAMSELLEARAVSKRFGGIEALSGVSFSIARGQIFGLIGPNGAGKPTRFNLLTGLDTPDRGSFALDGHELAGLKPDRVAARGVARTFQNIRLFANLSALENVMVGRHVRTRSGVLGAVLRDR